MIEKLNRLTNYVYQAALDGQWRPFIEEFIETTNSFNGWVSALDREALDPIFTEYVSSSEGISQETFLDQYIPHMTGDPFYIHSTSLVEAECFRGSDIVPIDELPNYDLYPLFEQAGCHYVVSSIPVRNSHFDSFVVLHRNKHQHDFSNDDLRLMQLITPHLNRAIHLHLKLIRGQQQASLYQSIITSNPYPLLVVDSEQNVLLTNSMAEHLMRNQTILHNRLGKLTTNSTHHTSVIKDFINSTLSWIQAKTPEPTAITLTKGSEKIMLRAYPVHAESDVNNHNSPCCVVEILSSKEPNWQLFQEEFSITPKEMRTTKLLYSGLNLNQVGENSNLSFNTVKSQLMSVYNKTGFSSQHELIANLVKYI